MDFFNLVTLASEVLLGGHLLLVDCRQTLILVPKRKKLLSNLVTLAGEVLLGGHLLVVNRRQTLVIVPEQKKGLLTG